MTTFPIVPIEGYNYQVSYISTWDLGYTVNGIRYRCDRSESLNTTWRYLSDSVADMYDALGAMLKDS